MEEKNQKLSVAVSHALGLARTSSFWIGLFAALYVAVLPMADTIALRNVALLALLLSLAWAFPRIRRDIKWDWPIILWAAYLLAFPLFTGDHLVAWQSFGGQWGRSLLAMLAGAGLAAAFAGKDRSASFYLGVVSAVPLLIHLMLFMAKAWTTSSIPWGYWGRETHHADLGYAAGQAVILLAATVAAGDKKYRSYAIAIIVAALLSTFFARSRAGLIFAVLGGVLVFAAAYMSGQAWLARRYVLMGLASLALAGAAIVAVAVKGDDPRWRTMSSELAAGFYGDAIQLECKGTATIEPQIRSTYGKDAPRIIASVEYGDGSRVVVLRAGLTLTLKHPWGSDGSRQGFQKLLRQECPNPAISMAHTHDGWLDTMLALGWLGAALYLATLIYFLRQGMIYLRGAGGHNEWALVLVALSAFWILRGFTDSVYRDHMLEMQGFMLAFAAVAVRAAAGRVAATQVNSHSAQSAAKTPGNPG